MCTGDSFEKCHTPEPRGHHGAGHPSRTMSGTPQLFTYHLREQQNPVKLRAVAPLSQSDLRFLAKVMEK